MAVAFMFQIFYAGYDGKDEGILIETEFFSQPDPLLFICGETFRVDAAVTDKEMSPRAMESCLTYSLTQMI